MSYERLAVKQETKELIDECEEEFIKHHPELRHMKISKNKLIFEICKYYLK